MISCISYVMILGLCKICNRDKLKCTVTYIVTVPAIYAPYCYYKVSTTINKADVD